MRTSIVYWRYGLLLGLSALLISGGCSLDWLRRSPKAELLEEASEGQSQLPRQARRYKNPPPLEMEPLRLPYEDSEKFDTMMEAAIAGNTPYIVIQTDATSPSEMNDHLLAWVAAWREGGPVQNPREKGGVVEALMIGVAVANNPEFHRFMAVVVDKAKTVSQWYNERNTRQQRVDMLMPYVLAFRTEPEKPFEVQLWNGNYSQPQSSAAAKTASAPTESATN